MKAAAIGLAIATLAIGGCAVAPQAPRAAYDLPSFDDDDHRNFEGAGDGSIRGQAFLRQKGGGVVTCAGSPVLLFPATSYFRAVVDQTRQGRRADGQSIPMLARVLIKESVCDAQGKFSFDRIPAGTWIAVTEVTWTAGRFRQGGAVSGEVGVRSGGLAEVIISQ